MCLIFHLAKFIVLNVLLIELEYIIRETFQVHESLCTLINMHQIKLKPRLPYISFSESLHLKLPENSLKLCCKYREHHLGKVGNESYTKFLYPVDTAIRNQPLSEKKHWQDGSCQWWAVKILPVIDQNQSIKTGQNSSKSVASRNQTLIQIHISI